MTTDRTFRIPADATGGGCHTDPTGTIAHRPASGGATFSHTGPANGCTLPGCSTTPDDSQTARWARREPLAVLLSRMQRGVLLPQERDLLRAAVQTELADGDQAREQLAEARALRFGAHDIEVCNQQRAAHTGLREALQSAFGVGDSVSDDDLFECVRQQAADLAAARAGDAPWIRAYGEDIEHARRGEAEAVRAREAAEQRAEATGRRNAQYGARVLELGQRAEFAEEQLTAAVKRADLAERIKRTAAKDAAAALARADAAEARLAGSLALRRRYAERLLAHRADARRNRDAWRNARKRAALMTAEVTRRAPLQGEYANLAIKAEAGRDRWKAAAFEQQERASKAEQRAERAEATLTAVRKAVAVAREHSNPLEPACFQCGTHHLTAIETALGDPQPATEPEQPAVAWAPRPCGEALWGSHGGHRYMLGGKGYQCPGGDVREQPTEPLPERRPNCRCIVTVTPAQVRDAVRHIIREDRLRPGDVIR